MLISILVFNQALVENGTGYLVGDSITLADLGLLEPLLNLEDYLGALHIDDYPALKVTAWDHRFLAAQIYL